MQKVDLGQLAALLRLGDVATYHFSKTDLGSGVISTKQLGVVANTTWIFGGAAEFRVTIIGHPPVPVDVLETYTSILLYVIDKLTA